MGSEFLQVARTVLSKVRHPMTIREIMRIATSDKLMSDSLSGKTPNQTLKSKLSQEIRNNGDSSEFIRTAPGQFYLRALLSPHETVYSAARWKKSAGGERVLVFDRAWLDAVGVFQGIKTRGALRLQQKLLRGETCQYVPRLEAESDDDHKQVLTYVLVTRSDGALLSFRRGNYTNVEEFLRGSRCIGFGGHVRETDRGLFTRFGMGVTECAIREISEELNLSRPDKARLADEQGLELVGVLNDESSDVGQRHIAFVYRFKLSNPDTITRGEQSVTQLLWLDPSASRTPIWEFEYWSQLCLLKFAPKLVDAAPSFRIRHVDAMRPPNIICMLGTVGSGKSSAAKVLESQYGYKVISSGKVLATLLKIPPVPHTPRDVFQRRALKFITASNGPMRLAQALGEEVQRLNSGRIVVDGIRQPATLDIFKKLIEPRATGVLFIHTTPDVAFELFREREGKEKTLKEFFERVSAQVEQDVKVMIEGSDVVLYNWTGKARYGKMVVKLMKELHIERMS